MPRQLINSDHVLPEITSSMVSWQEQSASEMNLLSVQLLLVLSCANSLAKLWTHLFCISLGQLENIFTILTACLIVALQMPLFLELAFIFL